MRYINPLLEASLRSGVTTLCWCWKIVRTDGFTLGMTDHDQPLVIEGLLYTPRGVMMPSVLEDELNATSTSFEMIGALQSDLLTERDLHKGLWQGASVTLMRVNWQDVSQQVGVFQGRFGLIQQEGTQFRAEIESVLTGLGRSVHRTYQKTCDAVLGGVRCSVDLSHEDYRSLAVKTAAVSVDPLAVVVEGLSSYADHWFAGGECLMLTGQNAGIKRMIREFTALGGTSDRSVILWLPFPFPIAEGDQMQVTVGCDKRFQTCRTKFNNGLNFRGCPALPGADWMIAYPSRGEGNTGGRR